MCLHAYAVGACVFSSPLYFCTFVQISFHLLSELLGLFATGSHKTTGNKLAFISPFYCLACPLNLEKQKQTESHQQFGNGILKSLMKKIVHFS